MSENAEQDIWQVEAAGKVYDTSFDEMTAWIAEGSLLRIDRVRKGNLRWIEAGKVPSLLEFFNAKDAAPRATPVVTVNQPENPPHDNLPSVGQAGTRGASVDNVGCLIHTDVDAAYVCETCFSSFCKACPKSYGGSVKICPMCGAMCRSRQELEKQRAESARRHLASTEGFGFGDFVNALAYPFKFKTSLVFGALMFGMFSLGQSAASVGGIFLMAAAIFCYLLANMLTFGVLANTLENFSQGKTSENFMPSFDDFSIWDDVLHPFFLSIGVYVSSFGPLILLVVVSVFFLLNSVGGELNSMQSDAAGMVRPDLPYAANAAKQTNTVRELLQKTQEAQQKRIAAIQEEQRQRAEDLDKAVAAADSGEELTITRQAPSFDEEAEFQKLNQMIEDHRKGQLEAAIGKTPETEAEEKAALFKKLLGYGAAFLLIGGLCLLWGMFYFPAACLVAGYTRSFAATLNPAVGLDTIKRLGVDYVKILVMGILILVASAFIGGIVAAALSPFDMPRVGNLPASFIGSLFAFYFSVAFSCVLGFAVFKNADRLRLFQS